MATETFYNRPRGVVHFLLPWSIRRKWCGSCSRPNVRVSRPLLESFRLLFYIRGKFNHLPLLHGRFWKPPYLHWRGECGRDRKEVRRESKHQCRDFIEFRFAEHLVLFHGRFALEYGVLSGFRPLTRVAVGGRSFCLAWGTDQHCAYLSLTELSKIRLDHVQDGGEGLPQLLEEEEREMPLGTSEFEAEIVTEVSHRRNQTHAFTPSTNYLATACYCACSVAFCRLGWWCYCSTSSTAPPMSHYELSHRPETWPCFPLFCLIIS